MEKTIKTSDVVTIYNMFKDANFTKVDNVSKVALWKLFKVAKPIGVKFVEDMQDAQQKLIPYEDYFEKLEKAKNYEHCIVSNTVCDCFTEEEYNKFVEDFKNYNKLVDDAIVELAEKEITISFEPIKEDVFDALVSSNNWGFEQASLLEQIIC